MIPICAAPKRFVAALNKVRYNNSHKQFLTFYQRKQNEAKTQYKAIAIRCNSSDSFHKTNKKNDFSTKPDLQSFNILYHESNRTKLNSEHLLSNLKYNDTTALPKKPQSHIDTITLDNVNKHVQEDHYLYGPRLSTWWTGKPPIYGICPGVETDGRIHSLAQLSFATSKQQQQQQHSDTKDISSTFSCTKQSLHDYFDNTWTLTEVLLGSLQGEEAFMRPPYHDLRHPMIFYYGHPAALYINKLRVAGLLTAPVNSYYEVIFETGVDEMSWDDLSKNQMQWPSVQEVKTYRQQVYQTISHLIMNQLTDEDCLTINQQSPLWALVMAFEHERIHLETSSVLIAELPIEYVRHPENFPSYYPSAVSSTATTAMKGVNMNPIQGKDYPMNALISVPEQLVHIGKPRDFPSFGWDNEYGSRSFQVPAFNASQYKITNGEFLEFVKAGGYANKNYWTETGWKWRAFRNIKTPVFWNRTGPQGYHEYSLRLLFDIVPMQWDWPVVVNLHEAQAYTNWKSSISGDSCSYRVMTELEHRAIRTQSTLPIVVAAEADGGDDGVMKQVNADHTLLAGGKKMLQNHGYNTNLAYASMSPVNAFPPNVKGFYDVFGNAWEWTCDYFCALPGFQVHPYYEDFSTPCFDGLHHVIQAGSFISTGNEASIHSRFHFRPHFTQHASFRIVQQPSSSAATMLTSDTDAPGPYVGNYPFRQSNEAIQRLQHKSDENAKIMARNAILLKHYCPNNNNNNHNHMKDTAMQQLSHIIIKQLNNMSVDWNNIHILDIGCGVGGLTFALATQCGKQASVIGTDHHSEYIEIARDLLAGNSKVTYELSNEGMSTTKHHAIIDDSFAPKIDFRTSDPMCLPAEMKHFDCVILNDILDKVSSPNSVLSRLGGVRGLVKPNGYLICCSKYHWKEETTPKELWLGGFEDPHTKCMVSSNDVLQARLALDFESLIHMPIHLSWKLNSLETIQSTFHFNLFKKK